MAVFLGDRGRFAVEVGEGKGGLRRVDLWAAGQWLTCDDNWAYVPQFRHSLQNDRTWLESGGGLPQPFPGLSPAVCHRRLAADEEGPGGRWWFLRWGPTTDNISTYLFREENRLTLTLSFWRPEHLRLHPAHAGAIFVIEISVEELTEILQNTITALDSEPIPPRS